MKLKSILKTAFPMLLSLAFVPGPNAQAHAAMISTGQAVTRLNRDASREKVATFLSRDDVRGELVKFGVNPDEATTRLASLSDAEVQKIADQIDQSTAGGDAGVVGILTIVLIVLLIIFLWKRI